MVVFVMPAALGKVHHLAGIGVNSDCSCQSCRCAILRSAGNVRAFARIVFLFNQMVSGPEGDKVSVVGWSWNRHGARATDVSVAKLESQLLQLVGVKVVIIPQDMIVAWPACSLNALVRAQIEVELCGVGNADIDCRSCRDVARLPRLFFLISTEQTGVVALLNDNEGDPRLVVWLQPDAGLPDGRELVLEYLEELAFTDTIAVHDDSMRFVSTSGFVEHHQMVLDHCRELLDDFDSMCLDPDCGCIP